ncbi:glycosyltransferase family 39 protein [Paludisphaera borealis]|uniref:Glycosyltransferase RgtA/B/C/D-like domain-containing protein n=1 Tax=Paludisphaera borealis TaxID=1387353 RepID=A0A1U7CKJ7_9BACT|nr:phospholipid carrier-dependent glycosyltransferase [Paludisphaera borealis]APW59428.1 putative glycosyltransferase of unknown function [Paludisphaera borealis]
MLSANRASLLGGIGVAVMTLILMIATESRMAIVWDEGYTLGREGRVRDWLRALRDPKTFAATWRAASPLEDLVQQVGVGPPRPDQVDTRAKLLDSRVVEWFWPFAREEPHGHPPFYAIVGMAGDVLAPSWELLPRARLGPMIAFSLTAGALFAFMTRRRGLWAGAATAGAWIFQPRLFAHGHYALYDALLTCLWVGSILAFTKAVEPGDPPTTGPRWRWVVAFGLLGAAAAGTKLTGWFLCLPFLAWTAVSRNRRAGLALAVGGLVALVALVALIPPWWSNPIAGVDRFLRSNLSRGQTTEIPTAFLGQVYLTPQGSLPWYNTLVWTAFVTPVGFLALALAGTVWAVRSARSRPLWLLVVIHWAFLLALRALPHTPGHDAERQFLPAFGCLALVAGLGGAWAVEALGRWGKALVIAALTEGAVSLAIMMPVPLSYYSPLVGGLPGAARLGMEPTYYWDALFEDALNRLNTVVRPGETLLLPAYTSSFRYLRQSGKLRPDFLWPEAMRYASHVPEWYIIQNRVGFLTDLEREVIARAKSENVLASKWGVPLILIFRNQGLERK